MGGCMSSPSSSGTPESARSKDIEKQLREDEKLLQKEVKLLLLGAGASGKSTVLKQMRLIHNVAFTPSELEYYRQLVFLNIVNGMKLIIDAMDQLELAVTPSNRKYISQIDNAPDLNSGQSFPPEYKEAIEMLWADELVQQCWSRGNENALPENLSYFYGDLDRVFSPVFKPTEQDILRCRAKTTGISETKFHIGDLIYSMFDVGGQRSERKKWIHCFENVTAILFLVALSGYDECLVEDKDSNQMQEALMLFDSIRNSQWFTKTSMILFLNKDDLFREKIKNPRSQIKPYFPDYEGTPGSYEKGKDYFKTRFKRLNRSTTKEVYVHTTTATDTAGLKVVMAAAQGDSARREVTALTTTDTIIRAQLRDMAIL